MKRGVEVGLAVIGVGVERGGANVQVLRKPPLEENTQSLPRRDRRVADEGAIHKGLVFVPHDLARIEKVLHGLLASQANLELLVEEKLLPVPFVDEDRFLTAGVLVRLEKTADLLLVEVGIVAAPSPFAPDPQRGVGNVEQLVHVQIEIELVAAGGIVPVLRLEPSVHIDHELVHHRDLEPDAAVFEFTAYAAPIAGHVLVVQVERSVARLRIVARTFILTKSQTGQRDGSKE